MRNIISSVHNRIRVWTMVMVLRTWIVHLGRVLLVGVLFADSWGVLDPMTTIWTIFSAGGSTVCVHRSRTVVNVVLSTVLATSWIQIACFLLLMMCNSILTLTMRISCLVLFWTRFLLSWRRQVPRSVWGVDHRRLIHIPVVGFVLSQSLHMISELARYRWWPPVVCTITMKIRFGVMVVWVLNMLRWTWLTRLPVNSLDDSWRKLTSWWSRGLCSSSGIFWPVWSLRRFRFLEFVALASIVLRSVSAFVCVHLVLIIRSR